MGQDEEALELYREAEALVRKQSAYRLAACLGDGCILFAFREDSTAISQLTEELLPLAQEHGFNLWTKMAKFFRGWTMADFDESVAGTALMQSTIDALELCNGLEPSVVEASFREAIAFAQGQSAGAWEEKASRSLARHLSQHDRNSENRNEPEFH